MVRESWELSFHHMKKQNLGSKIKAPIMKKNEGSVRGGTLWCILGNKVFDVFVSRN